MLSPAALLLLFTTTFVTPFVTAAEVPSAPLPQDVNYTQYIQNNINGSNFSTDPKNPRVAADSDATGLQLFIVNNSPCLRGGETVSYRMLVRNAGPSIVRGAVLTLQHPATLQLQSATPAAAGAPGTLTWNFGDINVGHASRQEINISFTYSGGAGSVAVNGTARGTSSQALTTHTVTGTCDAPPAFAEKPIDEAAKTPAIVCHPSERGCIETLPDLLEKLGLNFRLAANDPNRQPIICSGDDPEACAPNIPQLGERFAEAVANIIPGDCRVVEDDIISTPEFHDAFIRRTNPDALFIPKLWESGRDYSGLVHSNELKGLGNIIKASKKLKQAHTTNWEEHKALVNNVLKGASADTFAKDAGRWKQRIRDAQENILESYEDLQKERREDWPDQLCGQTEATFSANPADCRAVKNAQSDTRNACAVAGDGGLPARLPILFKEYRDFLDQSELNYSIMQGTSANTYDELIDLLGRELKLAAEDDEEEKEKLKKHVQRVANVEKLAFSNLYQPYRDFKDTYRDEDNRIRVNSWEIALDPAKTEATACGLELTLASEVETTWCESGNYPEFIISSALNNPSVKNPLPPQTVPGGAGADIDERQVSGTSCGGGPGDPFWAADCSCRCGDIIVGVSATNDNILLCQSPSGNKEITRHDIHITTREECFNEPIAKHGDKFF